MPLVGLACRTQHAQGTFSFTLLIRIVYNNLQVQSMEEESNPSPWTLAAGGVLDYEGPVETPLPQLHDTPPGVTRPRMPRITPASKAVGKVEGDNNGHLEKLGETPPFPLWTNCPMAHGYHVHFHPNLKRRGRKWVTKNLSPLTRKGKLGKGIAAKNLSLLT